MTEPAENTYPALPVRTDETVFITFAVFADSAALDSHRATLAGSPQWNEATSAAAVYLAGQPRTLRLAPTARSLLRG